MLENGEVLPRQLEAMPTADELIRLIDSYPWVALKEYVSQYRFIQPQELLTAKVQPTLEYMGNFEALLSDIKKYRVDTVDLFMFTGNEKRAILLPDSPALHAEQMCFPN